MKSAQFGIGKVWGFSKRYKGTSANLNMEGDGMKKGTLGNPGGGGGCYLSQPQRVRGGGGRYPTVFEVS